MDTTARLSLALLGSFEVTLDGHPVTTFESVKVHALLAYLAVEAGRSHARAFLAELLWPDLPAATALRYLLHVLAKLKQAIPDSVPSRPPFLLVTRETIALNPAGDCQLDMLSFTALLEICASHPHRHPETCRACARHRAAAVALYRGDFLEHFVLGDSAAFEEWAALKPARLRQQLLDTLRCLITYDERRGAYHDAQRTAWRQMEIDPWGDEAHRQLMRVLWLNGQRSAALDQYEHHRRILQQELGVEPSAETTVLYECIRAAATATPPDGSPSPPAHNLPAPTTPLIGREVELAQLADLLQQPTYRLITLSGWSLAARSCACAGKGSWGAPACCSPKACGSDRAERSIDDILESLEGLAGLAVAEEYSHDGRRSAALSAVRLLGVVAATRGMLGIPLPPGNRAAYEHDVAAVRDQLDSATWQAPWAEGQALTLEQAIAEALTEGTTARAHAL
jgi:DNA-binding SARP family transcriptional activator